jgi:hypothetical protein
MTFLGRPVFAAMLVTSAVLLAAGCGTAEKPIDISGRVRFKGEPVTEGLVQLIEDRTGRGAEVELGPDGTFKARLFAGEYKVVVTPPYLVDMSSGMPNPYYKKVKNIPKKYHSSATSGLTAVVSRGQTTHDFDLTP